jgi:hypothetical protein
MAMLLGARDLGLDVRWRFGFVGYGQRAETTPGVVFLDVGGSLKPGVVDHHSGESHGESACDLVLRVPEVTYNHLLSGWLARHEAGQIPPGTVWTPTIVTHIHPDFDGLIAAHLTIRLIEDGAFPAYAEALVSYGREVDQGRYVLRPEDRKEPFALHLAYLAIQNLRGLSFEDQLRLGFELLECVLTEVARTRKQGRWDMAELQPGNKAATAWVKDTRFDDVRALLADEPDRWAHDKTRATILKSVPLPTAENASTVKVRGLVLATPPESILNKYWARADGFPFFVCPYAKDRPVDASQVDATYPRVVLSVDPTVRVDGLLPTLQGLGFALEQAECAWRNAHDQGQTKRGGKPRFPDGYCDNDDPWFDGRSAGYTIVDAPNCGTQLPYRRIVEIATETPFWAIPLERAVVHLIWARKEPAGGMAADAAPSARAIQPFTGASPTLDAYFSGSAEAPLPLDESLPQAPGFALSLSQRTFPGGTCPPLTVLRIEAWAGSTLEGLLSLRERITGAWGLPDYVFTRAVLGRHFAPPERVLALLRQVAVSDVSPLDRAASASELVLFNGRTLILRDAAGTECPREPDPDRELLLYAAFLNETLVSFSARVGQLIPAPSVELRTLDTEPLRRDYLRFQAAYYQIEVSRQPRSRVLFDELAAALRIADHYTEVQSELDRLAQLEQRLAEDRQARAESILQFVLYLVAICGVLQTFVAFWVLDTGSVKSPGLWTAVGGILIAAVGTYLAIERAKRN